MVSITNDPTSPISENWSEKSAKEAAAAEGLELDDNHLEVLRALQEYYAHHDEINHINMRELHDALNEKFHYKGGMKYLYSLFPSGPIAQGCRLAGLQAPTGAIDKGFGSVA